jgi:hypothetical protein
VAVRAPNCHHSIDNNFVAFRHCIKFKTASVLTTDLKIHFKNEFLKPWTNTSNEKRRAETLLHHTVCSELIAGELLSSRAHVLFSSKCNLVSKTDYHQLFLKYIKKNTLRICIST